MKFSQFSYLEYILDTHIQRQLKVVKQKGNENIKKHIEKIIILWGSDEKKLKYEQKKEKTFEISRGRVYRIANALIS